MKTVWWIVGGLAALGGLYFAYTKWIAPSENGPEEEGPTEQSEPRPNTNNGDSNQVELGLKSIEVNGLNVVGLDILDSNTVVGYSKTSKGENPVRAIHFTTSFQMPCPKYAVYKGNVYAFHGENVSNNGIKTCYYRFNSIALPTEIVKLYSSGNCDYNLFIGSVEYRYKSSSPVAFGSFCTYGKV